MKITDVRTIILRYPYQNYIADGQSACSARGALLVEVYTDTEIKGLGECATFGASMMAMAEVIDTQLKGLLIGQNPLDTEFLWERMVWSNYANGRRGIVMGAISGIDIALISMTFCSGRSTRAAGFAGSHHRYARGSHSHSDSGSPC